MKLNAQTLSILKNFNEINQSIFISPGNIIRTMAVTRSLFARAVLDISFDEQISIYNLGKFLSVYGLFEDPELLLSENYMTISDNNSSVKYVYADPSITKMPKDIDTINLPSGGLTFDITSDNIKRILNARNILQLPNIIFSGEKGKINFRTADPENLSGDTFNIVVGETEKNFIIILKHENFKLMPGNYKVEVIKEISHFTSENDDLEYFIANEDKSEF